MHGNGPRSYGRPPTAACRTLSCASSPHAKVEPRMGLVRPSLGENGPTLRRARDEEWRACSMISERCACRCDSSGRTVSARREDRSHARDTSAQVQAGRRGIAPPIPMLHGLASFPGSKHNRSAQRLVLGGGLGRRCPNCTCTTRSPRSQLTARARCAFVADGP